MMSIAEVVEKLENFSATPLVAIPDGTKSYKYYLINNSRNNTTDYIETIVERRVDQVTLHYTWSKAAYSSYKKLLYLIKIKK